MLKDNYTKQFKFLTPQKVKSLSFEADYHSLLGTHLDLVKVILTTNKSYPSNTADLFSRLQRDYKLICTQCLKAKKSAVVANMNHPTSTDENEPVHCVSVPIQPIKTD